jgi:hypothetical protein
MIQCHSATVTSADTDTLGVVVVSNTVRSDTRVRVISVTGDLEKFCGTGS